jgi:hypothetical protein
MNLGVITRMVAVFKIRDVRNAPCVQKNERVELAIKIMRYLELSRRLLPEQHKEEGCNQHSQPN